MKTFSAKYSVVLLTSDELYIQDYTIFQPSHAPKPNAAVPYPDRYMWIIFLGICSLGK